MIWWWCYTYDWETDPKLSTPTLVLNFCFQSPFTFTHCLFEVMQLNHLVRVTCLKKYLLTTSNLPFLVYLVMTPSAQDTQMMQGHKTFPTDKSEECILCIKQHKLNVFVSITKSQVGVMLASCRNVHLKIRLAS